MRSSDDTSYDFASAAFEDGETQNILVDPKSRDQAFIGCRNSTLPLWGGNRNCSTYQGLQCQSDLCIFTYSIGMSSPNNPTRGAIPETPRILSESQMETDTTNRIRIVYYFLPFTRASADDAAILLNKVNGESFFFGKFIQNAWAPY
jgi:hypothetical protein